MNRRSFLCSLIITPLTTLTSSETKLSTIYRKEKCGWLQVRMQALKMGDVFRSSNAPGKVLIAQNNPYLQNGTWVIQADIYD